MAEKFPEIGSRFVPKDAPPAGAPVRQVVGHQKVSEGSDRDMVNSVPVKNKPENEVCKDIPLGEFNKNFKLI